MSVYIPGVPWESADTNAIFNLENQLSLMQLVEAALAEAQAELGIIPAAAAAEIRGKARLECIDMAEYNRQLEITGAHNVVSFLRAWKPALDKELGEYLHYGETSQDITDNACMLQLLQVHDLVREKLSKLRDILTNLAETHRETPMAGRTHLQQAVPITFGLKAAVWGMEVNRHLERLSDCRKRLGFGSFYGAAGTIATLGERGLEVGERMLQKLGLQYDPVPVHVARDTLAEFLTLLSMISVSFGKIASTLYELSTTEFGEIEEPWEDGNVGSSTMPQKRNPAGLAAVTMLSNLAESNATSALMILRSEEERDFRFGWVEPYCIPTICGLTSKILDYSLVILGGLVVYDARMRENLDLSGGLIMSESLMMRAAEKIGRFEAHERVHQLAMRAFLEKKNFKELVLADEVLAGKMSAEEIERAFDPTSYIGSTYQMVDSAVQQSRKRKEAGQ